MSSAAPSPRTERYADLLDEMIEGGADLARRVHAAAKPTPADIIAYDRIARCVRHCIMLARLLAQPVVDRIGARRQIIRSIEDKIGAHADPIEAPTLHAEFRERLDCLDLEDDIATRPIGDIIADIARDLGLAAPPGVTPWKRRTPADLHALQTVAARPAKHPKPAANPVPVAPALKAPSLKALALKARASPWPAPA